MKSRAFSLIELLAVMAMMAALMLLVLPSFNSVSDANKITEAGRSLLDQIDAARQQAEVSGSTVELRFLKKNKPGETHYTGMQLLLSGTKADKVIALPEGVAILNSDTFSPWFSSMFAGTMPASNTVWDRASYRSFKVRSSGAIEPIPVSPHQLFLTVASTRTAPTSGTLANYATIQVNPDTARPLLYRP